MSLNTTKCKVMHIGRSNIGSDYNIEDSVSTRITLAKSTSERDLGVEISKDLKPYNQICKAASTANRVLGLLRNTFVSRDVGLWKRLYTTYIRPHLEYAIQVWSPIHEGDISKLEKIQRRATRIPKT